MKFNPINEKILHLEETHYEMLVLLRELESVFKRPWKLLYRKNRTAFTHKIKETLKHAYI
tara:strand:+ start:386 stop:565 length:180 start_codon:yes stop_codon:yes gene_type:complete